MLVYEQIEKSKDEELEIIEESAPLDIATREIPLHLRKPWFEKVKSLVRLFIKPTEFIYLGGEKPKEPGIILCNHVGTAAPLAWELYSNLPFSFWGASEMNQGLVKLYKYQSRVFYHEKKHWNIHLARLFCLIASPLTNMFYKGLQLISTYRDTRFRTTIKESIGAIENGKSIIIFPEISDNGYLDELEGFHPGFTLLANMCLRHGHDVPLYVAYYKKSEKKCTVSAPVKISAIFGKDKSAEEICRELCDKCNSLGKM